MITFLYFDRKKNVISIIDHIVSIPTDAPELRPRLNGQLLVGSRV